MWTSERRRSCSATRCLGCFVEKGLLSEERIELLLSWRRSGFSVHNRVFVHPGDGRGFEALVRYMMRCPVSLKRLRFTPGSPEVVYTRKGSHDTKEPSEDEKIDAEEFVARVLVQITQISAPPGSPPLSQLPSRASASQACDSPSRQADSASSRERARSPLRKCILLRQR